MNSAAFSKHIPIRNSEIPPVEPMELSNLETMSRVFVDLERTHFWSLCWDPEFYIALGEGDKRKSKL